MKTSPITAFTLLIAVAVAVVLVSSTITSAAPLLFRDSNNNNNNDISNKIGVATSSSVHPQSAKSKAKLNELNKMFHPFREHFYHKGSGLFNHNHKNPEPHPDHFLNLNMQPPRNVFDKESVPHHIRSGFGTPNATAEWGYINVLDHGARSGDAEFDNTGPFQDAINKAASAGGLLKIFVPAGSYSFFVASSKEQGLTIPPSVSLVGVNSGPYRSWQLGSVLIVKSGKQSRLSQKPFLSMVGPDTSLIGFTILYPDFDPKSDNPPFFGPAVIQGRNDNLLVKNIFIPVCNNFVACLDFATHGAARHLVENVYAMPLSVFYAVDQNYDISRMDRVHLWDFYAPYVPGNKLNDYMFTHSTSLKIMRSDWHEITNVFHWGAHIGLHLACSPIPLSKQNPCSANMQINTLDFDNSDIGLLAEATQPYGVFVSNLNVANAGNGNIRTAIYSPPNSSSDVQLDVRGAAFWGDWNQHVKWNSGGKLSLTQFVSSSWNRANPAMDIQGGRASIQNGYFHDTVGTAIRVGESVDRAMIVNNDLVGNKLDVQASSHPRLAADNLA